MCMGVACGARTRVISNHNRGHEPTLPRPHRCTLLFFYSVVGAKRGLEPSRVLFHQILISRACYKSALGSIVTYTILTISHFYYNDLFLQLFNKKSFNPTCIHNSAHSIDLHFVCFIFIINYWIFLIFGDKKTFYGNKLYKMKI